MMDIDSVQAHDDVNMDTHMDFAGTSVPTALEHQKPKRVRSWRAKNWRPRHSGMKGARNRAQARAMDVADDGDADVEN